MVYHHEPPIKLPLNQDCGWLNSPDVKIVGLSSFTHPNKQNQEIHQQT